MVCPQNGTAVLKGLRWLHLGVVSVREGLVPRGEVPLVYTVLGGYGVLPAVFHVDHGSTWRQKRKKQDIGARGVRTITEKVYLLLYYVGVFVTGK